MTVSPTETNENIEIQDAVSTTDSSEGRTADSPTANEGRDNAESPAADQGVKETLVDRIKKAADVSMEKSPVSEGKEGTESEDAAKPEGEAAEEDKPFTKDDLPSLHSKTRKRVGKLLATMDTLTKERDQYRTGHEAYAGVIGFLKDNDLTMDDANAAFDTLYAIRHDPARALEMLTPIYQDLLAATGSVLPDDLKQQVQQGYITEAHAKELAKHRADANHRQVKATDQEQKAQRSQVEERQKTVQSIEQSITQWESKWASTDPDYQKKRSEVQEQIELALSRAQRENKLPRTAEEAVKLADDCRKRVEAKYAQFRPQKQEVRHVTGSAAGTKASQPKTLTDAILQAANG